MRFRQIRYLIFDWIKTGRIGDEMITVHKMHLGVEIHAKRATRNGLEINQELKIPQNNLQTTMNVKWLLTVERKKKNTKTTKNKLRN